MDKNRSVGVKSRVEIGFTHKRQIQGFQSWCGRGDLRFGRQRASCPKWMQQTMAKNVFWLAKDIEIGREHSGAFQLRA